MLYTSEQFATKQLMEHHENVAPGVTDGQLSRQTRTSSSRNSTDDDEYLREASALSEHDRAEGLDDPETRSQKAKAEVQNDVMNDRGSERRKG